MKRTWLFVILILLLFSLNTFAENLSNSQMITSGRSGNADFQISQSIGQSLSTGSGSIVCSGFWPVVSSIATLMTADNDGDGLANYLEDKNNNGKVDPGETDPNNADSDGDGIDDGIEDANHNGIVDPGETNPTVSDTDSDGMADGWELLFGLNPNFNDANQDADSDFITNLEEFQLGINPTDGISDSDHDTLQDRWELDNFSNLDARQDDDSDGDGYSNFIEYKVSSDPMDISDRPTPGIFYEYDALGRIIRIWRIPVR